MDIPISVEGFEGRKLMVRTHLWFGPKPYLDDQPLQRMKGSIFTKKRAYPATDNSGARVEIGIISRFFDPIPNIEIKGKVYELAPPFKWYQYLWMGIPVPMVMVGGAIGGALAAAAMYLSAVILRSRHTKAVKYALSGVISAIAIMVVLLTSSSIPAAVNLIETLRLKSAYEKHEQSVSGRGETDHSHNRALLTGNVWRVVDSFERGGSDSTDPSNPILGAKRYFMADGDFSQVYRDGSLLTATWRFNQDYTALILSKDESEYLVKILELTDQTLRVESDGMVIVHLSN